MHLNLAAAGFLDLAVVLTLAMRAGFWEATVVSIVANATLNYFFVPPIFNLSVADPQNWVALGVFEFAALLVSRLSIRARQEADRATRHERRIAASLRRRAPTSVDGSRSSWGVLRSRFSSPGLCRSNQ